MKNQTLKLMKLLILICFMLLSFTNCRKSSHYDFTGQVIGKGIDCGETYLIKVDQKVNFINDNSSDTYYADLLPEQYKVAGLEIEFNCRAQTADEAYPCTCLGIYHPHVIITEIEKK